MENSRRTTRITAIIVVALLVLTICTVAMFSLNNFSVRAKAYAGGTGTAEDPYLIADKAALDAFRAEVNGGSTGVCAKVTADITGLDSSWVMIGTYSNRYVGTFDGDGHTFTFSYSKTGYPYSQNSCGLFEYVGTNGVVKNVVADGTIAASATVGVIANWNEGLIENCASHVDITGSASDIGLVGIQTSGGTIRKCYNDGSISGHSSMGGIVGNAGNGGDGGLIENCYNVASLGTYDPDLGQNMGGIVGQASNVTIRNCFNTYNVPGCDGVGVEENDRRGALCGSMVGDVTIENCYYMYGNISIYRSGDYIITGSEKLTADEFKDNSYFNDWNFYSVWIIRDGADYPTFREPDEIGYSSGSIVLADLEVGDIIREGVTIQFVPLTNYRFRIIQGRGIDGQGNLVGESGQSFTPTFKVRKNGALWDSSSGYPPYSPINEEGERGNAWQVASIDVETYGNTDYTIVKVVGIGEAESGYGFANWSEYYCESIYTYYDGEDVVNEDNVKFGITVTYAGETSNDGIHDYTYMHYITLTDPTSELTFTAEEFLFTEIEIGVEDINSIELAEGWSVDEENKKIIWKGEPTKTVTLKTTNESDEIDTRLEGVFFTFKEDDQQGSGEQGESGSGEQGSGEQGESGSGEQGQGSSGGTGTHFYSIARLDLLQVGDTIEKNTHLDDAYDEGYTIKFNDDDWVPAGGYTDGEYTVTAVDHSAHKIWLEGGPTASEPEDNTFFAVEVNTKVLEANDELFDYTKLPNFKSISRDVAEAWEAPAEGHTYLLFGEEDGQAVMLWFRDGEYIKGIAILDTATNNDILGDFSEDKLYYTSSVAAEEGESGSGEQGESGSGEQGESGSGEQGESGSGEQGGSGSGEQGGSGSGEQGGSGSGEQGEEPSQDRYIPLDTDPNRKPTVVATDNKTQHNPAQKGDIISVDTDAKEITITWYYDDNNDGNPDDSNKPLGVGATYVIVCPDPNDPTHDDTGHTIIAVIVQNKKSDGTDYADSEKPTTTSQPIQVGVYENKWTMRDPQKTQAITVVIIFGDNEEYSEADYAVMAEKSNTYEIEVKVVAEVEAKAAESDYRAIEKAHVANNEEIAYVYDVKLINKTTNQSVQPSEIKEGTILKVIMDIPEELQGKPFRLLHIHAEDDIEFITDYEIISNGTQVEIEISKLSEIAFVGIKAGMINDKHEFCVGWVVFIFMILELLFLALFIIVWLGKPAVIIEKCKLSVLVEKKELLGLIGMCASGAIFLFALIILCCHVCGVSIACFVITTLICAAFTTLFFLSDKGKEVVNKVKGKILKGKSTDNEAQVEENSEEAEIQATEVEEQQAEVEEAPVETEEQSKEVVEESTETDKE